MARRSLAFVAVVAVTLASLLLAPTGSRSPLAAASPFASPAASPAFPPSSSPLASPAVTSPTPNLLATVQAELTATAAAAAFAPQRTAAALATQNAQLQGALAALATSDAGKGHALATAQATIAALTTRVADLKATINAVPTAPPTPAPTNTPVPTPTPLPKAGTVLYQANAANGAFDTWSMSSDWKLVSGMLVNDGSQGYQGVGWAKAPYQPSTADYAVEAEIQWINPEESCGAVIHEFDIIAREADQSGHPSGIRAGFRCEPNPQAAVSADPSDLPFFNPTEQPFNPGAEWHVYRLEVKGNTIRLLIDGNVVVAVTDNHFLAPGAVGLFCYGEQVNVRSFKVIAL